MVAQPSPVAFDLCRVVFDDFQPVVLFSHHQKGIHKLQFFHFIFPCGALVTHISRLVGKNNPRIIFQQ